MSKSVGKNISKLRKLAGFNSLGQLSKASCVSVATLSRIEKDIQKPLPETLEKLAPLLNVSYEHLMSLAGYLPVDNSEDTSSKSPLSFEIEKVLREENITFEGVLLDNDDKEDVIEFIKVALRAIRKRKSMQKKESITFDDNQNK
ncbi:hypothetical protein N752_29060 [Desulforamulus aquiferis]|nr:helix-turn-helix transcriptional regulator [Desulforamulus aquiferis]RYD01629.1 hypothetical protein N752_29060 [Desulforamulus aquiferis]